MRYFKLQVAIMVMVVAVSIFMLLGPRHEAPEHRVFTILFLAFGVARLLTLFWKRSKGPNANKGIGL